MTDALMANLRIIGVSDLGLWEWRYACPIPAAIQTAPDRMAWSEPHRACWPMIATFVGSNHAVEQRIAGLIAVKSASAITQS